MSTSTHNQRPRTIITTGISALVAAGLLAAPASSPLTSNGINRDDVIRTVQLTSANTAFTDSTIMATNSIQTAIPDYGQHFDVLQDEIDFNEHIVHFDQDIASVFGYSGDLRLVFNGINDLDFWLPERLINDLAGVEANTGGLNDILQGLKNFEFDSLSSTEITTIEEELTSHNPNILDIQNELLQAAANNPEHPGDAIYIADEHADITNLDEVDNPQIDTGDFLAGIDL